MNRVIPADALRKQRTASDPATSAWVSAHAGSGKTHVLAQRVVRLLLEGAAPSRLICLTFTKAAAANMSQRVFRTLAGWALMPDAELRAAIRDTGASPPDDLDIARRLFALAIETPGGLKIQTIHAFCERVLHLFPFEANAPADFRVVDDLERLEFVHLARMRTLEAAASDPRLGEALALVSNQTWDGGFEQALDALFAKRGLLRDESKLIARLPDALELAPGETEAGIEREIVHDGIACGEWPAIAAIMAQGKTTDRDRADELLRAASLAPDRSCIADYFSVFFIDGGKGTRRKTIATGAVEAISAGLPARLLDEGCRLEALRDKLKAAATLARTSALIALAADSLRRYTQIKRTHSALDFDDLIARTRNLLLRDGASSWVLYKLDGGVDHILVDEAQDTSEAQWDILRALAAEFTSGAGATPRLRTLFAVGDEKQSIFSFQGAAPAAFAREGDKFRKRAEGGGRRFESVQLDLSFRSARSILEAVDAVFANPAVNRGLTAAPDQPPKHLALKHDMEGMVEIWPTIAAQKADDPESWVLPVDLPRENDPPVELARRIARKIAELVAPGSRERVTGAAPGTKRAITPGDVMILVRRRDAFFEAMVRALKEAHVPVAGADRLDVGRHIAVMDMIAAARTALAPDDDLTLACVLKSPLCGLDDGDLMAIAPKRTGSLWDALVHSDDARHRAIAERIEGWRALAVRSRPFDFFSDLLGPEGGRRAFLERMGPEANDALDELMALALTHERQEAPSLAAFAHALETIELTVKRDMEAAGGLVRVMTAHAAKGLEAPIVFLPDTCATPGASHDPSLFEFDTPAGRTIAWSARRNDDPPAVAQRRLAARADSDDEYRRLLYVAMTRAEERLYVAGYCGLRGPAQGCWRELIVDALRPKCLELQDPAAPDQTILRFGEPLVGDETEMRESSAVAGPEPDWLRCAARIEREPPPPLRPSSALSGADAVEHAEPGARQAEPTGFARGLLIHSLLQSLPDVVVSRRIEVAARYIRARAPGVAIDEAEKIAHEAIAAMEAPDCAPLFGALSRAEVGVAARIDRGARPAVDIVGRIDRLAEVGDEIWIADFKTGARPAAVPGAYVAQLALYRAAIRLLYPARNVRAFLLWTAKPNLDEIAAEALEAALAAI